MVKAGLKVIILDFDGVIVESVGIKDSAFKALFQQYPNQLDEIMAYHLSNNAIVRFEKFKHIIEHILKIKYTEEIKNKLSTTFAELVVGSIINCPYVPGAQEFLSYFHEKIPMYLATASPAEEIKEIIEVRGLTSYFEEIYPIPWTKEASIRAILSKKNICAREAIFIGDSPEDLYAAQKAGVSFIARFSNKSFGGSNIPVCRDMSDALKLLCNSACS